jgi:hypothetical protein
MLKTETLDKKRNYQVITFDGVPVPSNYKVHSESLSAKVENPMKVLINNIEKMGLVVKRFQKFGQEISNGAKKDYCFFEVEVSYESISSKKVFVRSIREFAENISVYQRKAFIKLIEEIKKYDNGIEIVNNEGPG